MRYTAGCNRKRKSQVDAVRERQRRQKRERDLAGALAGVSGDVADVARESGVLWKKEN